MQTLGDWMPYAAVITYIETLCRRVSLRFTHTTDGLHTTAERLCLGLFIMLCSWFWTRLVIALSVYGGLIIALFTVYGEYQAFFVVRSFSQEGP